MTLQQITYFCAICEEMHYTKAASRMHVSQPCLSYAIGELEREMGVKLFSKKGKQFCRTEYGELFYPYAKRVLSDLADGVAAVRDKKDAQAEQINVGYLFSLSLDFLPPTIDLYYNYLGHHDQPINFVPCVIDDMMERINTREIDVAFAAEPFRNIIDTPLVMYPVYEQELYLLVPKTHRLAKRTSVKFDEIKDESYVAINPEKGLRRQMDEYFKSMDVIPKIVFSVNNTEALISYVEAGVGVTIAPRLPTLSLDKISLLRISDHPVKRSVCMLYSTERAYNSAAKQFISFVEESAPLNFDKH